MKTLLIFVIAILVIFLFGCSEYHKSDRGVVEDTLSNGMPIVTSIYTKKVVVGYGTNILIGDTVDIYMCETTMLNGSHISYEFYRDKRDSIILK